MMDPNHTGPHDRMHWSCCWKPMGGKILWILSLLAFLGGLTALWRGGEFYGVNFTTWYWTALVGGVLALGAKGRGAHTCYHGAEGK